LIPGHLASLKKSEKLGIAERVEVLSRGPRPSSRPLKPASGSDWTRYPGCGNMAERLGEVQPEPGETDPGRTSFESDVAAVAIAPFVVEPAGEISAAVVCAEDACALRVAGEHRPCFVAHPGTALLEDVPEPPCNSPGSPALECGSPRGVGRGRVQDECAGVWPSLRSAAHRLFCRCPVSNRSSADSTAGIIEIAAGGAGRSQTRLHPPIGRPRNLRRLMDPRPGVGVDRSSSLPPPLCCDQRGSRCRGWGPADRRHINGSPPQWLGATKAAATWRWICHLKWRRIAGGRVIPPSVADQRQFGVGLVGCFIYVNRVRAAPVLAGRTIAGRGTKAKARSDKLSVVPLCQKECPPSPWTASGGRGRLPKRHEEPGFQP